MATDPHPTGGDSVESTPTGSRRGRTWRVLASILLAWCVGAAVLGWAHRSFWLYLAALIMGSLAAGMLVAGVLVPIVRRRHPRKPAAARPASSGRRRDPLNPVVALMTSVLVVGVGVFTPVGLLHAARGTRGQMWSVPMSWGSLDDQGGPIVELPDAVVLAQGVSEIAVVSLTDGHEMATIVLPATIDGFQIAPVSAHQILLTNEFRHQATLYSDTGRQVWSLEIPSSSLSALAVKGGVVDLLSCLSQRGPIDIDCTLTGRSLATGAAVWSTPVADSGPGRIRRVQRPEDAAISLIAGSEVKDNDLSDVAVYASGSTPAGNPAAPSDVDWTFADAATGQVIGHLTGVHAGIIGERMVSVSVGGTVVSTPITGGDRWTGTVPGPNRAAQASGDDLYLCGASLTEPTTCGGSSDAIVDVGRPDPAGQLPAAGNNYVAGEPWARTDLAGQVSVRGRTVTGGATGGSAWSYTADDQAPYVDLVGRTTVIRENLLRINPLDFSTQPKVDHHYFGWRRITMIDLTDGSIGGRVSVDLNHSEIWTRTLLNGRLLIATFPLRGAASLQLIG